MSSELSIFVDESGDRAGLSRYYLLTLVVHDQSMPISEKVIKYEISLAQKGLPNPPLHSEPLLNGRGDYTNLSIECRKKLLYSFNVLCQRLPIVYKTFIYKRSEFSEASELSVRMKRDISNLLFEKLEFSNNLKR